MERNPFKTKVIIFREGSKPRDELVAMWVSLSKPPLFQSCEEQFHLAIMVHSWGGMCHAAELRAVSTKKSVHAMLSRHNKRGIFSAGFTCKVVNILGRSSPIFWHMCEAQMCHSVSQYDPFDSMNEVKDFITNSQARCWHGKERAQRVTSNLGSNHSCGSAGQYWWMVFSFFLVQSVLVVLPPLW